MSVIPRLLCRWTDDWSFQTHFEDPSLTALIASIIDDLHDNLVCFMLQGTCGSHTSIEVWHRRPRSALSAQRQVKAYKHFAPGKIWIKLTSLRSLMNIDFWGPIKHLNEPSNYVRIVVDRFSQWPSAMIHRNNKPDKVLKLISKNITIRGVPRKLYVEQGSGFTFKAVKKFCSLTHFKQKIVASESKLYYVGRNSEY